MQKEAVVEIKHHRAEQSMDHLEKSENVPTKMFDAVCQYYSYFIIIDTIFIALCFELCHTFLTLSAEIWKPIQRA